MAKLQSLVEKFKEKELEQENLKVELGAASRKPGRPRSKGGNEKARLNFLLDKNFVDEMKALAAIKKISLTTLFVDAMKKEIENNKRDIDILQSMQKQK